MSFVFVSFCSFDSSLSLSLSASFHAHSIPSWVHSKETQFGPLKKNFVALTINLVIIEELQLESTCNSLLSKLTTFHDMD